MSGERGVSERRFRRDVLEKKEKKKGKEVAFPPFQGARRRYNEGQSIFVKERFRPISPFRTF